MPHFMHFQASGPLGNCRGRDLELNALIGIEIGEILEFCQKLGFWVLLGVCVGFWVLLGVCRVSGT